MNGILSVLIAALVVAFISSILIGCASVGTGSSTLVPAKPETEFDNFKKYFPDLVSDTEDAYQLPAEETTVIHSFLRLLHFESLPPGKNEFDKYISKKLGSSDLKPAELSVVVRDRTKIPPFMPVDMNLEEGLLTLFLGKETVDKQDSLAERARGKLMNVPDVPMRTSVQDTKLDEFHSPYAQLYFYYPRIQIDFASRLRSPSQLDRFDYLGMVVKLKPDPKTLEESTCDMPRIINFEPKAADILEFSRGNFTQKAELNAKTQAGIGKKENGASLGQDLSLTMSETFVNSLNDSLETRTSGILDEGQTFFADFRAIKNKRIGGTYNYDMMLEVPALLEKVGRGYRSNPCCREIRADVYLVGVVRHVYQAGTTGILTKVPEPDNDKTFNQVVERFVSNVLLWKYNNEPWSKTPPKEDDSSSQ